MVITFWTEREWLAYKLYALVKKVFNEPAFMLLNTLSYQVLGNDGVMFISGNMHQVRQRLSSDPILFDKVSTKIIPDQGFSASMNRVKFDIPTDDWTIPVSAKRGIPTPHLVMTIILILIMVLAIRFLSPGGKIGPSHFLFLGAGFMLVEVHSISKVALLFGSTWIVNAVIIGPGFLPVALGLGDPGFVSARLSLAATRACTSDFGNLK
jgi:hypothetical protein